MVKMIKKIRNKKGFVLVMVMVTMVLLSSVGLGLLKTGSAARLQSIRTTAEMSARASADAGLTKALFEMNKDLSAEPWRSKQWLPSSTVLNASLALPAANANYTYKIEELVKDYKYKITSTGQSSLAEKTVSLTVRREGMFDYPLFAQGYAHPKRPKHSKHPKHPKKGGKIKIKGYNLDNYSSDPKITPGTNMQLRTNSKHKGSVKLEKDIVINGDVIVGPGGKPEKVIKMRDDVEITGDIYTAPEMYALPAIIVPDQLDKQKATSYTYQAGKPLTGKLRFKDLKMSEGAVQEVKGNCEIYVEKDMKLEEGAKIIVTKNASLTIYVGKKLEAKKDKEDKTLIAGITNETKDPTKLIIYGTSTCDKIKLERMGDFYGAVYAPCAKVEIKECGDIYGALAGWDVKIEKKKDQANGTFYFDEALRGSYGTARFVKMTWQEEPG